MNRLRQAHENVTFKKNVNKYVDSLLVELSTRQFFREASAIRILDAQAASIFFESCIDNIEDIFSHHLNSYSAMRWFFYFRRLPNAIFAGDLNSTLPYARALIESYASQSNKEEVVRDSMNGFVFELDESALRHIARFVAFCNIAYDLQVQYRFANKGVSYSFGSAREVLPTRNQDVERIKAVKVYDQRHNVHGTFLSAALVKTGSASTLSTRDNIASNSLIFWGLSDEKPIRPSDFLDSENYAQFLSRFADTGYMIGRYGPSDMNLAALFEIYRRPSMSMHTISERASLSLISLLLGGMILNRQPLSILRVVELGYFIVPHEFWIEFSSANYEVVCNMVREYLPQFSPPVTVDGYHSDIAQYYSSTWPLIHGNPIRLTESYVCVDMWAASQGFLSAVQFPAAQGRVANDRAEKFEDVVQEALDRTLWANEEVRTLRQKPLRYQGNVLTDIDAIGFRDGTLLIISCKSIPYSSSYDKGEHRAIRNAESMVTAAVEHWNNIVGHLQRHPTGENYDFAKFDKIVGVVCTPFVIYTSSATSLTPVFDNLRPASSLEELVLWMETVTP